MGLLDRFSRTFDKHGYDLDGYDLEGHDENGFDNNGYDENGYDGNGHDLDGYDGNGHDKDGYDRLGYDHLGYNQEGYNEEGYNKFGKNKIEVKIHYPIPLHLQKPSKKIGYKKGNPSHHKHHLKASYLTLIYAYFQLNIYYPTKQHTSKNGLANCLMKNIDSLETSAPDQLYYQLELIYSHHKSIT